MKPMHEWTRSLDQDADDPLEIGKNRGLIRRRVVTIDDLTERELANFKIIETEIR